MKTGYAALLALVLFAAGLAGAYTLLNAPETVQSEGTSLIGGPFSLVDTNGKRVTDDDFRGKLMLVFFGYSHCPDVCPTELQTLSTVMEKLGPAADKVAAMFISVDPKRDTPQVLAAYMKNFNPRIMGLTGDQNEIASAAKAYRVYHQKVEDSASEDYTVDHSAFVYLMDGEGKYLTHFSFNTEPDSMLAAIKNKIAADKASGRASSPIAWRTA
jgi:protein SCO1/2